MTTTDREQVAAAAVAAAAETAALDASGGPSFTRARRQSKDASQVYSVRIPVDKLEELRSLAEARGVQPTALMRQFVLERLEIEAAPVVVTRLPDRDPHELRLGPSRSSSIADIFDLPRAVGR